MKNSSKILLLADAFFEKSFELFIACFCVFSILGSYGAPEKNSFKRSDCFVAISSLLSGTVNNTVSSFFGLVVSALTGCFSSLIAFPVLPTSLSVLSCCLLANFEYLRSLRLISLLSFDNEKSLSSTDSSSTESNSDGSLSFS
jgi:hypothetical protein